MTNKTIQLSDCGSVVDRFLDNEYRLSMVIPKNSNPHSSLSSMMWSAFVKNSCSHLPRWFNKEIIAQHRSLRKKLNKSTPTVRNISLATQVSLNLSISSRIFQKNGILKVVPIHKVGDKMNVTENYKPHLILCCVSKVLEARHCI